MSAFCFSPEIIDFHLLQLWLRGLTVSQATSVREDADPILRDVLEMDTADHFRLFEELQPSLQEPRSTMCLMELAPNARRVLAESFYSFDDVVVREFLGRKFTTRARNDLDEISEFTGVPRRSCLRQFDNLKRIYDAADEIGFQVQYPAQTRLANVLGEEFCLPRHLMQRYEAILFLMHHRFNIASGRKKNAFGSLREYEYCATVILNAWCVKAPSQSVQLVHRQTPFEGPESPLPSQPSSMTMLVAAASSSGNMGAATPGAVQQGDTLFSPFDLDPSLFSKFRDLRMRAVALTAEILASVLSLIESPADRKRADARFRPWFRALLSCATGKDLKDFFEDLVVTVVEPLLDMRFEPEKLFELLDKAVAQNFPNSYDIQIWSALMAGIKPCTVRFVLAHPQRSIQDVDGDDDS